MLTLEPAELRALGASLHARYRAAAPYPHRVLDGLFDRAELAAVAAELAPNGGTWHRTHLEQKRVVSDWAQLGAHARALAVALNGPPFLDFLTELTGIEGLVADTRLERAGYMDVPPGGFLAVHADQARSSVQLVRRVNALLYLNDGWQPAWGGSFELYDQRGNLAEHVLPELGRLVVFDTPGALHGHTQPVAAPGGRHRLAFSAYYYTSPSLPAPGVPAHRRAPLFVGERQWRQLARRLAPPVVADLVHQARERRHG